MLQQMVHNVIMLTQFVNYCKIISNHFVCVHVVLLHMDGAQRTTPHPTAHLAAGGA